LKDPPWRDTVLAVNSAEPRSTSVRLASLDIGRMAACWYVMLFHASMDVHAQNAVLGYGFSGVQFFMMLSGYVLARPYLETQPNRPFSLGRYALGRVTRILPPYYVVVLLAAAMTFLGHGSSATPVSRAELPWHVFAHLAFVHTFFVGTFNSLVSVLWSLGLEWQYYVVMPALLVAFRARRPWLVMLVVIVFTVLARQALTAWVPERGYLLRGLCFARLTEFAAGVALAALLGRRWSKGRVFAFAVVLGGLGLASVTRGAVYTEFGVQGVVLVVFTALRLFGPAVARSKGTRFLQFLGEVSYSTYLVHTLAGKTMLAGLAHVPALAGLGSASRLALYALAGQLGGIAFYTFVEKPTTLWAGRLVAPRAETATRPTPERPL
jgi:peptidoglycan/LPS O-acetylase OafA/YrhL